MRRQAFVNWERVTEDNIPESGKEYMVAEIMDETVAKLRFAKWYNEGDVVELSAKKLKDINEMTMEERLLQAIFGAKKEFVIPKSGFYLQTADFGIDDDECLESMVPLEENTYFAEKPLVPEGFLSEEQQREETAAKTKQMQTKMKEDALDKVKFIAENDKFLGQVIGFSTEKKEISYDIELKNKYHFGIFAASTYEIATSVISSNNIITGMTNIIEAEGGEDKLVETLREAAENNTLVQTIKDIIAKNNVEEIGMDKQYLNMYLHWLLTGGGFYHYRNRFLSKKQYNNMAHLMVKACLSNKLMFRLKRCCKLRLLGAPEIISSNELRMYANLFLEYRHVNTMEISDDNFAETFGIYMDGSEFEGLSDIGNFERETPYDDGPITITDEDGNEVVHIEQEEKEEPIDRFCIVDSPNFRCLDGYYALYNPKQNKYYRADGKNVSVYTSWKDARDVREEINK